MNKTKIAIVGASGYSGQELVRLLLGHPHAEITQFTSRQYAGKPVSDIFPRFRGRITASFIEPKDIAADVVFLALPHGVAAEFAVPLLAKGMKVLDLSADFRLKSAAVYKEFYDHDHPAPELLAKAVYGLPELHREKIKSAQLIACPGCYPTSIILGTVPALRNKLIDPSTIIASSMSGVSGAGRKATEDFLFCECNESARAYGIPKHRHLSEIEEQLGAKLTFIPHLIPLNRGIESTIIASLAGKPDNVLAAYREFYRGERFVRVTDALPDTKNVESSNYCDISVRVDARTNRLIISSAIDNLTKGAAGQAVQCLNLVCGYPESAGLL
ncbi:MAG: N-acetyl-gamma-glutamyl-phosphate reductase [Verrucomicrobiae bacterium]|nr:N-acetyl-gamma-glutamyl-phosphate reductase [Verrucomicrobiae bacterium]